MSDLTDIRRPLVDQEYTDGAVMCPRCWQFNTHVKSIQQRLGTDHGENEPETRYRGVPVAKEKSESRRANLVIQFTGECGHRFRWVIVQHKGLNVLRRELWMDDSWDEDDHHWEPER